MARADCADGRPQTAGHRGTGNSSADNPYPENTIVSLLAAADEGATMVEIDVQLSADDHVVLMHDPHVESTTDGSGCVRELTRDELQALDAAAGTPMAGTGITVPTLAEVLDQVPLGLNVEIKMVAEGCPQPTAQQMATALSAVLEADPMSRELVVSSFDLDVLDELRAGDPQLSIGMLTVTPITTMVAVERGYDALHLIDGGVDEAAVATVHDAGLQLTAWTVNDPERISMMFDWGVDRIITDDPPLVEQERQARCGSSDDTAGDSTGGSDSEGSGAETSPGGTAADASGSDATGAGTEGDSGCACRGAPPGGNRGYTGLFGALMVLMTIGRQRRAR